MSAVLTSAARTIVAFTAAIVLSAIPGIAAAQTTVTIANTAGATFDAPIAQMQPLSLQSNTVSALVRIAAPTLRFCETADCTTDDVASDTGEPLYVRVDAPACAHDLDVHETLEVTIRSVTSGDEEHFTVRENRADSSQFDTHEPINTAKINGPVSWGNDLLELWGEDELEAEIIGCAGVAIDTLLIDPDGVVYDSQSNQPIAGARVTLIDVTGAGNGGHPGEDAVVFDFDQTSRLVPTQTTGANGRFQFPYVAASEYRLQVEPPGDYEYPSGVPLAQQPAGRILHASGSFGGDFSVNATTGAVTLDVPLDPGPEGLVIEKRASRASAEIAESVEFTVQMQNTSGLALSGMQLHDELPAGFTYVTGSARVGASLTSRTAIADPAGGLGPVLDFALPDFAADANVTLSYRVAIGPGALQGDGTNRARLSSASPARKNSNLSTAHVDVQGGVFDERGFVLGRVFADCNRNGLVDRGEAGVPRVRLYLEDGSYVITDGEGKYSFYGVVPRTHVLKVDGTTLPDGVKIAATTHRQGKNGNTRFLDVQRGEMARADFATDGCVDSLAAQLAARKPANPNERELDGAAAQLRPDATPVSDVRGLPASGVVGGVPLRMNDLPRLAANGSDALGAAVGAKDLRTLMPTLDAWLGFVDLYDGAEVGTTELTVRVKGQTLADIRLIVNDAIVSADRIGLKLEDPDRHVQAIEYVGVTLAPGANTLSLAQKDDAGHFREVVAIRVTAPGALAHVKVTPPAAGIPADGEHLGMVRVSVVDIEGTKVTSRTPVTLETTGGEWAAEDLDPAQPGLQIFVSGGEASIGLRARTTGTVQVRATTGQFSDAADVSFVSALRPLIAAGVIEGTLSLQNFDRSALRPARRGDGFERELASFGRGEETSGGARAALFLKGKIRGDYLLTLGYDSDKDTQGRLFRDIEPDKFYPVYGDSSIKGYDAQTTGRLYVRIERNKSYFLGGDITTQALGTARLMGAYNRSLTGLKEHFENDRVAAEVFASRDSTRQVVDEIPANGTSGPFSLSNANLLENSELVEILTRDRDQPSIVIASVVKRRYVDYDLEPFTGRLLFRAPIPSVTEDLDPISVRVTYEVEQGGDEFWTAGVDTRFRVSERMEVGASFVDDQNPEEERRIGGVNTTLKFGKSTIVAEAARTESDDSDGDLGTRVEWRHEGDRLQVRALASRTDENFDNPSAGYSADRTEAGGRVGFSLSPRTRLIGEVLHSEMGSTGAQREGGLFGVERSFAGNYKAELGVRHVIDTPADSAPGAGEQTDVTSVRARVTAPLPFMPRAAISGEYEQDVENADARVAALGGEYRLADRSRFYARHEFISSLSGPYDLDPAQKHNTTVFGVDSTYWHDDAIFSEYRIADALAGRDAQAAIGLRNNWNVAEGVRLDTSFERVDSLSGLADDSSALTGAVEYTRNPKWKGTARLELRDGDTSDSLLSTLGFARKLSSDWTLLARGVLSVVDNEAAEDRHQARLQAGTAYRDSGNRVNALVRYEYKREEGIETGLDRLVHIVSAHADLQQTVKLAWRGQFATKLVEERFDGMERDDGATLFAGRMTYDLAKRWDVGVQLRGLFGKENGMQGGVGAEAGFLVSGNLWLSAGYNVLGFRDEDLAGDEYTTRGAYLRLRFKFDETVLK